MCRQEQKLINKDKLIEEIEKMRSCYNGLIFEYQNSLAIKEYYDSKLETLDEVIETIKNTQ